MTDLGPNVPPGVALALGFIAASPTEDHAAVHEQIARERGATDLHIAYARRLMAANQAQAVQTVTTHPTQGDALP